MRQNFGCARHQKFAHLVAVEYSDVRSVLSSSAVLIGNYAVMVRYAHKHPRLSHML